MTALNLVRALADDLEITRAQAEDFLLALRDLCIDVLRRGEAVSLPDFCRLTVRNGGKFKAVKFQSTNHLIKTLGLREEYDGELCKVCKKNPRAPMRDFCNTCKKKARKSKIQRRLYATTTTR